MVPIVAVRHRETLSSGHSRPCIIEGEALDGTRHEAVLKLREDVHGKANGLACEFVASRIAKVVGLNAPTPFIAEVSEMFADSVPDPAASARYHLNIGRHFASELVSPQAHAVPFDYSLPPSLVDAASAVIAFDALLGNDDRHFKKSNYLIQGSTVMLIDHERAFPPARHELRAKPWEPTGLDFIQNHVFYRGVCGEMPDWAQIRRSWVNLTDPEIRSICRSIPAEWNSDGVSLRLESYLLATHSNLNNVFSALEALLR
jgi:hypothetical protein